MTDDQPLSGRRVLVLEDEYFVADQLARELSQAGAVVVGPFACADGALEVLDRGGAVDFGVLAVNQRAACCYPVAAALKARGVPFMFVTDYDSPALTPDWAHTPRLRKPFETRKLIEAMPPG